jgi:DNA-binding response OmpR family regulator
MKHFDKDKLGEVDIYLGEPNEQVRESMRSMMRGEGLRRTRTFGRIDDLLTALKEAAPDLLVLADDMAPNIFEIIRDLRQYRVGRNPFVMITMMVTADKELNIKKAILAGCDDIMIKPVAPGRLLERVDHLTFNRIPFIVTTDYLGPERRRANADRPSAIKQLVVVNSLREKAEGRKVTQTQLTREVERCMNEVMTARLDSHGLKLAYICNLILKAYEEGKIDKEVEERLLILVSVLEDAARTARGIGEPELANICTQLARQVEETAEHYENPTDNEIGIIRKLTKAFELAKTAKTAGASAPVPLAGSG